MREVLFYVLQVYWVRFLVSILLGLLIAYVVFVVRPLRQLQERQKHAAVKKRQQEQQQSDQQVRIGQDRNRLNSSQTAVTKDKGERSPSQLSPNQSHSFSRSQTGLPPQEVADFAAKLAAGVLVLKFGKWGSPHPRILRWHAQTRELEWEGGKTAAGSSSAGRGSKKAVRGGSHRDLTTATGDDDDEEGDKRFVSQSHSQVVGYVTPSKKAAKTRTFPMGETLAILQGKESKVFKQWLNKSRAEPDKCLSIQWASRSLDIQVGSRQERDFWILALQGLKEKRDLQAGGGVGGEKKKKRSKEGAGTRSAEKGGGEVAQLDGTVARGNCPEGTSDLNAQCLVGIDMFFNNDIEGAEAYFKPYKDIHGIFSLSYGAMGFLKALMTWEASDIKEAQTRLADTTALVAKTTPPDSWFGSGPKDMTPVELESLLIQAETWLLSAVLCFTQESWTQYIVAGLNIRSAYKAYERCEKQISHTTDPSCSGGINFGLGSFNAFISILPPILLKIVAALGFPSDLETGLKYLHDCVRQRGIRAPLASLTLLLMHVVIPSFFTVRSGYHIKHADDVLASAFAQWPGSALFLWYKGRLLRSKQDLPGAVTAFQSSAAAQPKWHQLQHLNIYEIGFCFFFLLDFKQALVHFERLRMESSWSKGFFAYMAGLILLHEGKVAEGTKELASIEGLCQRKFGGKTISVEQFVMRKAKDFLLEPNTLTLPCLEMVYLFAGYTTLNESLLRQCVAMVVKEEENGDAGLKDKFLLGRNAVLTLLKAVALRWLKDAKGEEMLEKLASLKDEKDVGAEVYTIAFARFELGSLYFSRLVDDKKGPSASSASSVPTPTQNQVDQVCTALKSVKQFKPDFNFKVRLHLRHHLACCELKAACASWGLTCSL